MRGVAGRKQTAAFHIVVCAGHSVSYGLTPHPGQFPADDTAMLGKLLSRLIATKPRPAVPPGTRVYAIGDIHGRSDLLDVLLERIRRDDAARPAAETHLVFLGDLIDRGPDSRGEVERVMAMRDSRERIHLLKGNHEEVFLQTLDGDAATMRLFARIGGRETLASYGIGDEEFDNGSYGELVARAALKVPASHRRFLAAAEDCLVLGDYLFVHAGVRPEVELDAQVAKDLRWIRGEFLDFEGELNKVVVHGHSVADEVQERPHRIGIDTGAFRTGTLTALALEGAERWFLQARLEAVA